MLLELFANLHAWGARMSPGRMKLLIAALLIVSIACIAVPLGLGLEANAIAVLLGAGAGLCWIVVVNFIYWFLLKADVRDKLDYRSSMQLSTRRWVSGVFLVLWFAAVLATNQSLGTRMYVLLGALNVFVLVSLARFVVASDGERENWSARKEQELRDKLFTEAYEKGLIDEDGNLTVLGEKLYGEELEDAEAKVEKTKKPRRKATVVEEDYYVEEETVSMDSSPETDEAVDSFNKFFGKE